MSMGIFTDKEHEPTRKEIAQALGQTSSLWEELIQFISDNYQMEGEFIHYGKKYGWTRRYRKSGKALTSLFPAKGYFVAQIVLNPPQTEKALGANLSKSTLQMIKEAKAYHDGRWLWIKVASKQTLKDVKQLLLIKRKPVKK
ncbi:MAG: DUF3788 domain-containing protein [Candidatus Stahlbacteria bacterium]|nr:MAG: DUF3788 domain-containing protein [Candidatus Stahlbacteria bacterium]